MRKPTYAVTGSERVSILARRGYITREQRRKTHLGSVAAYRRIATSGAILFTGAFVWVVAAFVAMVYAWRKI